MEEEKEKHKERWENPHWMAEGAIGWKTHKTERKQQILIEKLN